MVASVPELTNRTLSIELNEITQEISGSLHNWAVIRFNDIGKGISENQLLHIFDFYYSTKSTGTGLGLSVAQQIIEEHGGRIEVESKIGIGSTFSIFLPKDD